MILQTCSFQMKSKRRSRPVKSNDISEIRLVSHTRGTAGVSHLAENTLSLFKVEN